MLIRFVLVPLHDKVGVRNTIKSFAPDLLMSYTLEEGFHTSGLPLTPYSTFFDGVCMLADISGFTRLSGTFCERGKDGIDQLQLVVNGYLGQLVKIVYAYGGDVMKFAGDALVCVFLPSRLASIGVGRTLTLADVCSNAIQCATEVAEQCTDSLTVHVAISCGPICFAMLGGMHVPISLLPFPSLVYLSLDRNAWPLRRSVPYILGWTCSLLPMPRQTLWFLPQHLVLTWPHP